MQMQSQSQTAQPQIPNPPRAITTKDLLYIKDVLSWELLAFKKFHHLAQQVTNPEIKQALEKAGQMHQNHYQRLLPHLQVNNNAALANLPNQQTPLQ
jgi:rubrerythrin